MKIRTFLFIAVVLAGLFIATWLSVANMDVLLHQRLTVWNGASVTVGMALLLCLLLGGVIVTLAKLSQETGLAIERWRSRKASRKIEEIEEEYSRGLVAVLEGREEEALAHFRGVLEHDSRHFNTLLKIGDVLRHQERHAEAIEYHRKAHHIKSDDTRPLYALVEDHEAKGDMDRARVVLGKIIGVNKQSVAAWRKLRSLHMKEGNWEEALEAHERVEKYSDPSDPKDAGDRRFGTGIRHEIAASRLKAGQAKEACSILRRVLKEDPSFIPAHVRLGEALREQGQDQEAVQTWCEAFETTGSPIFLTVLEDHYLQREQPLAAIEALKRCVARARKDTLPRFYLGKLYFRLEMLDDAYSTLSLLGGRATYAPTLHYLLGRIHERRNNHREAMAEYRKVIKEMDLVQLEYRCRACGETVTDWADRCGSCGEWNSVEVNFREEIPLEELGLAPAPIYTPGSEF
jgi:lipopolysaccharide biosynthesis regulator YciM